MRREQLASLHEIFGELDAMCDVSRGRPIDFLSSAIRHAQEFRKQVPADLAGPLP